MQTELPGADADTHANWPELAALSYDNGDEWPRTVNGIEENDLFDGLQYAG